MVSPLQLILLATAIYVAILMTEHQQNQQKTPGFAADPQEGKDPSKILVDLDGKKVPLSSINKPHHVVDPLLHPAGNKPVPNPETFPDVEPEAKEREAKLAEERR